MTAMAARERRDAVTVLIVGILAGVATLYWCAIRVGDTFGSSLGVAWTIAIDETPVNVTVGSSTGSVEAIVREGVIHSDHVNTVSVVMIVVSLVASTMTALLVIACVMYLARCALRGVLFTTRSLRVWDVIAGAFIGGGALMLVGDTLGGNGVLAAVGLQDADVAASAGFWGYAPMWAIGMTCGLLSIVFRRGLRLQRDTEGLV